MKQSICDDKMSVDGMIPVRRTRKEYPTCIPCSDVVEYADRAGNHFQVEKIEGKRYRVTVKVNGKDVEYKATPKLLRLYDNELWRVEKRAIVDGKKVTVFLAKWLPEK